MTTEPPTAKVIWRNTDTAKIRCPYSPPGETHTHLHKIARTGRHHMAPHCGLYLAEQQRLTGYQFNIH